MLNRSAARLAMSVFQRRLASSTYALLRSFERRIEKLDDLIEQITRRPAHRGATRHIQRRMREEDDVLETKTADEEAPEGEREENEVAEDELLRRRHRRVAGRSAGRARAGRSGCATWPTQVYDAGHRIEVRATPRSLRRSQSSATRSSSSSRSTATRSTSSCSDSAAWATPARSPKSTAACTTPKRQNRSSASASRSTRVARDS